MSEGLGGYLNIGVGDGWLVLAPGRGLVTQHLQQVGPPVLHNVLRNIYTNRKEAYPTLQVGNVLHIKTKHKDYVWGDF
jgi:hypothetical protein